MTGHPITYAANWREGAEKRCEQCGKMFGPNCSDTEASFLARPCCSGACASAYRSVWTRELVDKLIVLTGKALSLSEIAKQMGLTKNQVVGKRKRLGIVPPPEVAERAPSRPRSPQIASVEALPSGGCRWPMWPDDARPSLIFCDHTREPGKPYCAAHCSTAYIDPKARAA